MSIKVALPVAAAVLIGATASFIQGKWSERWHTFPELEVYAKQFTRVPLKMGEWTSDRDLKTDAKVMEVAGGVGDLTRLYRNANNDEITMFMICGRPQDISYHTPDRCYPAAGFEKMGSPTKEQITTADGTDAEFLTNIYTKTDAGGAQSHQRVYWSFCSKGDWLAPEEDFKWTFGGTPAMYKLYVMAPAGARDQARDDTPAKDFIRAAVPELKKAFAPATNPGKVVEQEPTPQPAKSG